MRLRRLFLPILVILPLAACPAPPAYLDRPQTFQVEGPFVHVPSGMTFPASVDDFRRIGLVRYDKEGLDVSAGYNSTDPSAPIIATIYVYPAPPLTSIGSPADVVAGARERLCQNEFVSRKGEIAQAHRDATFVGEKDISLARGEHKFRGKQADYTYMERFGGTTLPASSSLYLFCYVGEKWTVKYRFTAPRGVPAAAIASFIDHLPWTISGMP